MANQEGVVPSVKDNKEKNKQIINSNYLPRNPDRVFQEVLHQIGI